MLLLLMASSKVIVIIMGTLLAGRSPGTVVPSSEQKQSGKTQTAGSHGGALFGSVSISASFYSPLKINLRVSRAEILQQTNRKENLLCVQRSTINGSFITFLACGEWNVAESQSIFMTRPLNQCRN